MPYIPTDWKNLPSTDTPINAENLNKIEDYLARLSAHSNTFLDFTSGTGSGIIYKIGFLCQMDVTVMSASLTEPLFSIPSGFKPSINFDTPLIDTETGRVVGELAFNRVTDTVSFNGLTGDLNSVCRVSITYLSDDV